MNEEEYNLISNQVRETQLSTAQSQVGQMQSQLVQEERDTSMLKEQLDLNDDMKRIDLLLRGWEIKFEEDGTNRWVKPSHPDMVVFSDYGIQLIMDTIAWYINKNTLLSNYEDDVILDKMLDFTNDLNDDIFMNSEKVFKYPTTEECIMELKERIKRRVDIRMFAKELLGKKADKKEIEDAMLKEMENRIEEEIEIIKQNKMKNKLKRYPMIMRKIQDAVHSTYLRAWKGAERTSLRKHMHVTETKGGFVPDREHRSLLGFGRK